ncbi:Uncharacterized conserved protein [Limimonas halophila]|uniref:Uncharacterized conserved protein n=1 Tax=Limimonas halophila TaxID=1082479 RepID=A0A1G7MFX2_9PROT|nr:exopolysaccharide biosynthesis protein [Limimonas halophila]SDF60536.1 Uncharacterized conserved protein [Limimonas halophila]
MAHHWLYPLTPTTADLVAAFPDIFTDSRVRLVDVLAALGERGLASALLVLAAPQLLPTPLGLSNIVAVPAVLVTVQMAFGRGTLWLPRWLLNRVFPRERVLATCRKLIPILRAIEILVQPRLAAVWSSAGVRFVGVFAFAISLISVFPLPFSGWLPAISLILIAAGLLERDGLVVIAGVLVGMAAVGVFVGVLAGLVEVGKAVAA